MKFIFLSRKFSNLLLRLSFYTSFFWLSIKITFLSNLSLKLKKYNYQNSLFLTIFVFLWKLSHNSLEFCENLFCTKQNFFAYLVLPAPADFKASTLTCASLPVVPVSAKMINDFTDNTICAGTVVNYTCNAGGINAFRVILYLDFNKQNF